MTYSAVSGIILALLYAAYHLAMRHTTLFAFNRHMILAIIIFSAAVPLTPVSRGVSDVIDMAGIEPPELEITLVAGKAAQPAGAGSLADILSVIYITGSAATALWALFNLIFICYIRLTASRTKIGYTDVYVHNHNRMSPFCWGNMIFVPSDMLDDDEREIEIMIAHESSHRRHMHWIDLLAANAMAVINWYNPCAWATLRELISIHEYEADCETLAICDDPAEYQLLLIKKTAGSRFHAFADSLNHSSLKKRITMMMKNQSKSSARLRALALLPAMAAALCVTNISCVGESGDRVSEESLATETVAETEARPATGNSDLIEQPAIAPEFEGGISEFYRLLSENINYPEKAMEKGISGKVILELIIGPDGQVEDISVTSGIDKMLDDEAIRAVKKITDAGNKFKPAYDKDGNPVRVTYMLPVSFRLE